MNISKKTFFPDKEVSLSVRGSATVSETGVRTFSYTNSTIWIQEIPMSVTAQEMYISKYTTGIKEFKKIMCRDDVTVSLEDKIIDGSTEFEILEVVNQYRSGILLIILRRFK